MTASNVIIESDNNDSLGFILGNTIILMFFLLPFTLIVIFVITVANYILDRIGVRRVWPYVLFWTVAGGLFSLKFKIALPIALLIAVLTGAVYWVLTGRVAGKPEISFKNFKTQPIITKFLAYAAGAYIAFVVVGWLFMGGKMLWVTVFEPSPGEPPFSTQFERDMTARMKIALKDFPDAQSCVSQDAGGVTPGILVPLDRGKIRSEEAAQVCIFRLLATYGDVSMSGEWFEGQGFRVSTGAFSAKKPNVNRDGTLSVHAYWSIQEMGLPYRHRSFFIRAFNSIARSMKIYTRWSADGQTLLWVNSYVGTSW